MMRSWISTGWPTGVKGKAEEKREKSVIVAGLLLSRPVLPSGPRDPSMEEGVEDSPVML